MAERIMGLCRVDGGAHWCAECCDGRNCQNYNNLPDGSWGCLGWKLKNKKKLQTIDGQIETFPQPEICREVDCLDGIKVDREKILEKIRELPTGEFFMSEVVREIK